MNIKYWASGIATLLIALQAHAGEIKISDAWARATVPGQAVGLVGMVITSPKDALLIAVSSPVSATGEIHTMTMDNGVMKMRQIEHLPLPQNEAVTLGPGGNHLMLMNIKQMLKTGDTIPLTITVQFADKSEQKVEIKAMVRPIASMPGRKMQH